MVSCGLRSVCAAGGVAKRQQPGTAYHQHTRAWEQRVNTSRTWSRQYLQKQGSKTESRTAVWPVVHANPHSQRWHLFSRAFLHTNTHTARLPVHSPPIHTAHIAVVLYNPFNSHQTHSSGATETTARFFCIRKSTSKSGNGTRATVYAKSPPGEQERFKKQKEEWQKKKNLVWIQSLIKMKMPLMWLMSMDFTYVHKGKVLNQLNVYTFKKKAGVDSNL